MEDWLLYFVTFVISSSLIIVLWPHISFRRKEPPLPPGTRTLLPIPRNHSHFKLFLRSLVKKHGPIFMIKVATRLTIFIGDRNWAHKALIQQGASFADRPKDHGISKILSSGQRNISSAPYGPVWRALRRNITAEILHPSRVQMYATSRKWMLSILIDQLKAQMEKDGSAVAIKSFQFAMFCLLVVMCFGERLDEEKIREIEEVQMAYLNYLNKLQVFAFFPAIAKIIFRKRWNTILSLRKRQEDLFMSLIRAPKEKKEGKDIIFSYVDSLLDLNIPEDGGRKLTEDEIVTLCTEFLTGGTDTTATALEWIMANLVKQPEIQQKLCTEIEQTVGKDTDEGAGANL